VFHTIDAWYFRSSSKTNLFSDLLFAIDYNNQGGKAADCEEEIDLQANLAN